MACSRCLKTRKIIKSTLNVATVTARNAIKQDKGSGKAEKSLKTRFTRPMLRIWNKVQGR